MAMNYRKNLYKLYTNVKNVSSNEKFKWNILQGKSYEKNILKKISIKFSTWKDTLCSINASLYDLYVHEYTFCWT